MSRITHKQSVEMANGAMNAMSKKEALRLSSFAEEAKEAILCSSHDGEVIPASEAMALITGLEELIRHFSEQYAQAE